MGLAVATRLLDLGRQSPWLDEVTNWQLATENGFRLTRSGHPLTYLAQSLGLALSDSTFGLRLYSALFGIALVAMATRWAQVRLGLRAALTTGIVFALSPILIFYSQDANHYAPILLSGCICAVMTDALLAGERRRWGWLLAALLACAAAIGFHPVAVFPTAAAVAMVIIWLCVSMESLRPRRIPARTRRLILLLAVIAAASIVVMLSLDRLQDLCKPTQLHGRRAGFSPDFLGALLGGFYGAYHHFTAIDALLGVTGLLLSVIGWRVLATELRRPWAAVGCIVTVLIVVAPFFIIQTRQYFSPRYIIAAVPALLLGVAVMASGIATRTPFLRGASFAAAVWLALFTARFLYWEANRLTGDFQPSRQAIEWIRRNTPDDTIVMTRHRYSSLTTRFLWDRTDMGARQLVALSYLHDLGAPAIQQAEEIISESARPCYFLSMIEAEDMLAPDFRLWVQHTGAIAAWFPSNVPDAFVPIEWGIHIWKLNPPTRDPFALPRDGVVASALLSEDTIIGAIGSGFSRLQLPRGATALYRWDATGAEQELELEITARGAMDAQDAIVLCQDDTPPIVYMYRHFGGPGPVTLAIPGPFTPGRHELSVTLSLRDDKVTDDRTGIELISLRETTPNGPDTSMSPLKTTQLVAIGETMTLDSDTFRSTPANTIISRGEVPNLPAEAGKPLVLTRRIGAQGLGPRAIRTRFSLGTSAPRSLHPLLNWCHRPLRVARVVSYDEAQPLHTDSIIIPVGSFRPRVLEAVLEPLVVYQLAEPAP